MGLSEQTKKELDAMEQEMKATALEITRTIAELRTLNQVIVELEREAHEK